MKIGINAQLLKIENSGVENCIRGLVEALLEIDSENEYVLYLPKQAELRNIPDYVVRRTRLTNHLRPVRVFWEHVLLPQFLVRDKIDVFHSPGYILPPLVSVPSVVSIHDLITLLYPSLCKRSNALYYRLFLYQSAKKAQRIIVHSEKTKEDLINYLGIDGDKIAVIYPGISKGFKILRNAQLLKRIRRKYLLPEEFILFVGNLEPKKNVVRLIRAFLKLRKEKSIKHSLVIVGRKGWKHKDIFGAVKGSPYGKEVIFTGYVPDEDLPAIYNLAGLFVFPSIYEGFGLPPLEAMACGLPVITSNAGSLPEVVQDAGIMVSPNNTDELAEVMLQVLMNRNLREGLITKSLRRAKLFSWEKTARATLEVYEQVYKDSRTI